MYFACFPGKLQLLCDFNVI